jgi:hypothetical protein
MKDNNMKNSTIIVGVSALVLLGAGAYIYFKGKKVPITNSLIPTQSNPETKTVETTVTTVTTSKGNVVNSSLGLPTNTTASKDETKTNNYIIAKKISEEIASLQDEIKNLELEYTKWSKDFKFRGVGFETQVRNKKRSEMVIVPTYALKRKMEEKSKQANALGYKILPYGLIEKM